MFEQMTTSEYFKMNAKLQQKKNKLRKALKEKGVLERKGKNTYDDYKYFSEAQYKELFTELLADNDLELKFSWLQQGMMQSKSLLRRQPIQRQRKRHHQNRSQCSKAITKEKI